LQDIGFAGLPTGLGRFDGAGRHLYAYAKRVSISLETLWCYKAIGAPFWLGSPCAGL
jgi:hypothetical protein